MSMAGNRDDFRPLGFGKRDDSNVCFRGDLMSLAFALRGNMKIPGICFTKTPDYFLRISREITIFWISLVPSPIVQSLASR